MRFLVLSILFSSILLAQLSISELKKAPRSIAKDYYIWLLLESDISSDQAKELLAQASRVNRKLFLKFAKKIDDEGFEFVSSCMEKKPKQFLKSSSDCIEIGLSAYKATKLSSSDLLSVVKKIKKKYPKKAKIYEVIGSKNPFSNLLLSDSETFFGVFNSVGSKFREQKLNKIIPQKSIKKIQYDKKFNTTIKLIVTNPKLTQSQLSLFDIDTKKLNHKATFFLAINAIKYGKLEIAKRYLDEADKKAYFRFDKDKVLFWKYKISHDSSYLDELVKSFDINIYTQFANEKLDILKNNVVSSLSFKKRDDFIKIDNVFDWVKCLDSQKNLSKDETKKLAQRLYSKDQEPYAAFMMERLGEYKKHYFLTPYIDTPSMKKASKDRVALILALARQESRFVPLSISTSYALGMMQFMPFVARGIANGRYKKFDLEQMFEPKWAYKFANIHLDYLQKHLDNPLFVAYAYNGGIGYTRKQLKGGLFKSGKYEPWMSMELISYDETRRYGKKVLSNYIIYKSLVDESVSLESLIKKLSL